MYKKEVHARNQSWETKRGEELTQLISRREMKEPEQARGCERAEFRDVCELALEEEMV